MSAAEHTPGPWTIERVVEPNGIEFDYIESSEGWAHSGMSLRRTVAHVGHWRDRPNGDADARLIAAAPDLLAACRYVVDIIQGGDAFDKLEPWAQEIVIHVNAAIAKARGEAVRS